MTAEHANEPALSFKVHSTIFSKSGPTYQVPHPIFSTKNYNETFAVQSTNPPTPNSRFKFAALARAPFVFVFF